MLKLRDLLNKTYEKLSGVPWDSEEVPKELIDMIDGGMVKVGRALDLGCGTGHYSIYLAQKGFDVTGIDIAEKAIDIAKRNAKEAGVNVQFFNHDAKDIASLDGTFDFIFEWGLLHFVMPEFREKYINDVAQKVNQGGKYVVLTFNEQSPEWGGGKYRVGLSGTPLYYSSVEELEDLYAPYFNVLEKKIRPTLFKNSGNEHLENYFLLERK